MLSLPGDGPNVVSLTWPLAFTVIDKFRSAARRISPKEEIDGNRRQYRRRNLRGMVWSARPLQVAFYVCRSTPWNLKRTGSHLRSRSASLRLRKNIRPHENYSSVMSDWEETRSKLTGAETFSSLQAALWASQFPGPKSGYSRLPVNSNRQGPPTRVPWR